MSTIVKHVNIIKLEMHGMVKLLTYKEIRMNRNDHKEHSKFIDFIPFLFTQIIFPSN